MNINLSLSGASPGEGAGTARSQREKDQPTAAEAFGGLFAGLQKAAEAKEQDTRSATPAQSVETPPEPELPIWPALVQDGLPDEPVDAAVGKPVVAAVAETATEIASAGDPEIASLGASAAPDAATSTQEASSDAEAPVLPLPHGVPADPSTEQTTRAASDRANPSRTPAPDGKLDALVRLPEAADAELDARRAHLAQAESIASQPVSERSSRPAWLADHTKLPSAANGAQPVRQAQAGHAGATANQAPISIQLPDNAAAKADTQVGQLGAADLPDLGSRFAERAVPLPDGVRPASGLDALSLNTSPVSATGAARGADSLLLPGGAQQAPVPAGQLAQHAAAVIRQMGGGRSEARIELHPAELGHLDLELRQDGQKLELSVTVDNEQTRRLVQDQLAQWRERLADSGMDLKSLDVEVRDQQASGRQDSDGDAERATDSEEQGANNPTSVRVQHGDRALDLYA